MNRTLWLALAALAALATPAWPNAGSAPPKDPMPSSTPPESATPTPRQEAERLYGNAYEEVARAKQDLAAGKTKNVEKRFKKALDWSQRAAELDPYYHEAWNLVGYASRKLGRPDEAIEAYLKAIELKFDYAAAREYLGEAWLEKGDVAKARDQLRMLERLKATAEAAELEQKIAMHLAANPEAAKADAAAASAPPPGEAAPADTSGSAKP